MEAARSGEDSVKSPQKEVSKDETHVSWTDFAERASFHGIRYIFERAGSRFRRPLWAIVVITAVSLFLIQTGYRTRAFFDYQSTTTIGTSYNDSLRFPAITICNQNKHRMTAVVEYGLYDVVDEIFKTTNISEIPWHRLSDRIDGIVYRDFTHRTGHQKHFFIDSCMWNGVECDIDRDFKAVLTDMGLCYTFNGLENNSTVYTHKEGVGSGLKLVINIEQYDYMRGPQDDAGIKILLHLQDEKPVMKEQGFAASPGSHTLVAMKRYELTTLEPPYGICKPGNPAVSQCRAQCQAQKVIKQCKCQTEYMEEIFNSTTSFCDFKSALSCVRQTVAEETRSQSECRCSPPCEQVHYEPQLSYAQLSKFNIDRMILDNPDKQKVLQRAFLKARETTQRYIERISRKDNASMTNLIRIADGLHQVFQNTRERILNMYNYLPMSVMELINQDIETMHDRLFLTLYPLALNVLESNMCSVLDLYNEYIKLVESVPQMNQLCFTEFSRLELNSALDSSEDVDSLTNVTARCKVEVQIWLDFINSNRFSYPLYEFEKFETAYQKVISSVFESSQELLDTINNHKDCLQGLELGKKIKDSILMLRNYSKNMTDAWTLENYKHFIDHIFNITEYQSIATASCYELQCEWIISDIEPFISRAMALILQARSIMVTFFETFYTMFYTLSFTAQEFPSMVKPILDIITAYMNGNITKMHLAEEMHRPNMTQIIGELAGFESNVYISIQSHQEALTKLKNVSVSIYDLVAKLPVPFIEMRQLFFFRIQYDYNQDLDQAITQNRTNVQNEIDKTFWLHEQMSKGNLISISGTFKHQMTYHLDILRNALKEYAESNSLNANFFMENFLQLDVFHKDMSYEVVTQQEAFGVLSLLGEVGGFLGLLLGASVITVCELLDYILQRMTRRFTGRMPEKSQTSPSGVEQG